MFGGKRSEGASRSGPSIVIARERSDEANQTRVRDAAAWIVDRSGDFYSTSSHAGGDTPGNNRAIRHCSEAMQARVPSESRVTECQRRRTDADFVIVCMAERSARDNR